MPFTHFESGNYSCHSIEDTTLQARDFFESLPGFLRRRTIDLCFCDLKKIFSLAERAEYTPSLRLFQLKENDDRIYVYSQEINLTNDFLFSLEQFLRENMTDVPADKDENPAPTFVHYYDTPFTLIPTIRTQYDVTRMTPRGKLRVIENVTTVTGPESIDGEESFLLRMIAPKIMEQKLQQIEREASYTVLVKEMRNGSLYNATLLLTEYRNGWDHFVMKRE